MPNDEPFHFKGFSTPRYTQVPDEVFDVLLSRLTEAELKVLLYVIRRTFGFKKDADAISLTQLTGGIKTLDSGTGMSRSTVLRGIAGLIDKGILVKTPQPTKDGVQDTNVYSLRFVEGVVSPQNYGSSKLKQGVVSPQAPQDSSKQDKDLERYKRSATPGIEHMFENDIEGAS